MSEDQPTLPITGEDETSGVRGEPQAEVVAREVRDVAVNLNHPEVKRFANYLIKETSGDPGTRCSEFIRICLEVQE